MTFEWLPLLPGWAFLLLALVAGGLLAALWRALRRTEVSRVRLWLTGLRAAVLVGVLLLLLGPVLTTEEDPEGSRTLAILVDTSQSMGVTDGPDGRTRLAEAVTLAKRLADEVEDEFEVATWYFDEDVRPAAGDAPRPVGAATRLRESVARFAAGGARAGTVVVLSDGIETGPTDGPPLAAVVHAVPVGTSLLTVPNVGFGRVEVPETQDLGTKAPVRAEIVVGGDVAFRARLSQVALGVKEGGDYRLVETLDLREAGVHPLTFEIEAKRPGFRTVELLLSDVAGEVTGLDNRRLFVVEARDPDFRVLYFSSRLDQEFRTIRREAAEMVGVDLTSVIEVSPGRFLVQGAREGDDLGRGLPADPAKLERFHAIVLGGFPAASLSAGVQEALRAWVEQGGGLVWLAAGDGFGRGGWATSPLADVTPLAFGASDPPPLPGPLSVFVAPEAANHPLAIGLAAAFQKLASPLPVDGLYPFGSALPGSTVVLVARGPDGRDLPVLATTDVGQGRVVVLGTSTFFRWKTVGGAPAAAYAALWRQVLRYAASRAEERARLVVETDEPRYRVGDVAVVTAIVRDERLEPATSGSVGGSLLGLDGTEGKEIAFLPSAERPGTFTSKVVIEAPRSMRVAVWATDGHGGASEREALLRVGGAREGERVAVDRDALMRLAGATGGEVFAPERFDALVNRLTARERLGRTLVTRSLLHDGPWGFLLVFLLALADWLVRRWFRKI